MTDITSIIRKIIIESMNYDTVLKFDPTDRIVQALSDVDVMQVAEQDCKLNLVEIWSRYLQEEHDSGVIYTTFRDQAVSHLQTLRLHGVVQLAENQKLLLPTETEQEQLHIDPEDRTNAAQQLCLLTLMHDELKDFKRVKPLMEEK